MQNRLEKSSSILYKFKSKTIKVQKVMYRQANFLEDYSLLKKPPVTKSPEAWINPSFNKLFHSVFKVSNS